MPATPCFTDFKETLAKIMPAEDAHALMELVRERAEARRIKRNEAPAEALGKSVEELISELDARAKARQIEYRHNAIKHQNFSSFMQGFKNDWSRGLAAFWHGIESNIPNSRLSVSANIHSRENDFFSYLNMQLEKEGVDHIFNNRKYDRQIGLARAGIKVDNPLVMKAAEAIKRTYKYGTKLAGLHGIHIDDQSMEDYVARTTHNVERMKSPTGNSLGDARLRTSLLKKHKLNYETAQNEYEEMAYQRWQKTIRPLTDEERTLSHVAPGKEDKFFRSFYRAVTTGVRKLPYTDTGDPVLTGLRKSYNLAQKLTAERVWHPKGAGEWLDYNKQYGLDSFHDAVITQIRDMGRGIGLIEKTGTNPRAFADRENLKYERLSRDQGKAGAIRRIKNVKRFVPFVLGDLTHPMTGLLGKIMSGVRMIPLYQLGMLAVRSQPDTNVVASALSRWNVPYLKAVGSVYKDFTQGLSDAERKGLAIRLGLYSHGTFMNLHTRWGAIDTPKGMLSRLLELQDKYSLINRWDNSNRYTMGSIISNELASHLDKELEDLKPNIQEMLGRYGIDKKTWGILQTAKGKLFNTKFGKFLTPDIVHDIADEDIATKFYGNKLAKVSPQKALDARQQIYNKLLNLYQDQSLYGKTLPTLSDRSLMQMGIKNDSFFGQVIQTILLFRRFAFANLRRTLGRFTFSGGAENMYDALVRGKADFKGLAKYIAGMLPFGYMALTADNLLHGEEPPDPTDMKTWLMALMSSGGGFFYGDLIDSYLRDNGDLVKALGGRGLSMWDDIGKLIYDETTGKGNTPESAFVRFVHKNLPLGNLFFIKPIIDHAIFDQIQQQIDPMYKHKLEKRLEKHNVHMLHLGD